MHLHHHHHRLLYLFRHLSSFMLIIFLHINLRSSSARENNEHHTVCSLLYECGNITATFPFWGYSRPSYCGHPLYHLHCDDYDNTTSIVIGTDTYRVMNINNETLNIARMDLTRGICPSSAPNNSILRSFPQPNFDFTSSNTYLEFYYNCSSLAALSSGTTYLKYRCSLQSNKGVKPVSADLYTFEYDRDAVRCSIALTSIPVLERSMSRLWRSNNLSEQGLVDVVNKGSEVRWSMEGGGSARCRSCRESGGQCGYDSAMKKNNYVCFCSDRQPTCLMNLYEDDDDSPGRSNLKKTIIGAIVGGVGTIFTCLMFFLIFYLKKRTSSDKTADQKMEDFFKDYGSMVPKRFEYKDVKKMTNSFKEKLGQGGYGDVFKGQLRDGRLVAVKVLFSNSKGRDGEDFINEVASISKTCHVNVVTLLGFCFDGKTKALVYEFMSNGSLEKFIYNEKQSSGVSLMLGWKTLYEIAIGIAHGLEYLHRGCTTRILHFDIKPHNILLDEDFRPKISDFGLAKMCPGKESIVSMVVARGTVGYIAPEVFNKKFGNVTHKSDVYSYGMMVLEMVGGRKTIDIKAETDHSSSQLYFPEWIHHRLELNEGLGLHGVMNEEREKIARKMIIVGLWCIQTNQSNRPSMSKVLEMLEGSVEALSIPPKPFLSSPLKLPSSEYISSSTISMS